MIDLRLHDQVIEQGKLLLQLLHVVRERSGEAALGDDTMRIAEQLFSGLDRLYEGLDTVVSSAPLTGDAGNEPLAPQRGYQEIVEHVHAHVARHVPSGETVAVVSRGDGALVDFSDCLGWHYPQNEVGTWAGYHPRDGADAIAHLDELRARGARYLVVPATSAWWLDWYVELAVFLEHSCTALVRDDTLALFALAPLPLAEPFRPPHVRLEITTLSTVMSTMLPAGATVFEVAAEHGTVDRLTARAHSAWGTDAVEEQVIDGGQLSLPLLSSRNEARTFLVVDAEVRERLKTLAEHERETWRRMRCVFDRTDVGAIFELSDQFATTNETQGAWA